MIYVNGKAFEDARPLSAAQIDSLAREQLQAMRAAAPEIHTLSRANRRGDANIAQTLRDEIRLAERMIAIIDGADAR